MQVEVNRTVKYKTKWEFRRVRILGSSSYHSSGVEIQLRLYMVWFDAEGKEHETYVDGGNVTQLTERATAKLFEKSTPPPGTAAGFRHKIAALTRMGLKGFYA